MENMLPELHQSSSIFSW